MGIKPGFKKYSELLILILFPAALFISATFEEVVIDKTRQIEYAEKQIQSIRESIDDKNSELLGMNRLIDSVESEINDLDSFLKNYENESYMTPDQIAIETNMIIYLAEEVERIQESFKKKVINLYKHGKNYDLELLFSSKSPNEYLRRNQYLQIFSQSRKKELRDLKSKKFILEEKKKMLNLSTSSQRFYVEARRHEKAVLFDMLKVLKAKKEKLEEEINIHYQRIQRYEKDINRSQNYLGNLESNKVRFKGNKLSRLNYDSFDLNTVKGNLNQPLDAGLLSMDFGNYINNQTNTVSFNNGVNYSVANGSKVYAIASGIVTVSGELPFYGKCIIIKHENGFRTVYATLSEINVSPGDLVKLNQIIGRSGDTFDGQMLHFELWKDLTPLNPAEWMRR